MIGIISFMDQFDSILTAISGIRVTAEQKMQFQKYEEELLLWNGRFNLTAIQEVEGIRIKHFLDSASIIPHLKRESNLKVIDVGTGAGFPGMVLKILLPDLNILLLESVHKKADFCAHVIEELKLSKISIITRRAEEIGQDPIFREKYDYAVARAVAPLPTLAEYLLPLVRVNGKVIAQKGAQAHSEVLNADRAIKILGGNIHEIFPVQINGLAEERYLVLIDKISQTPMQYPRHPGLPSKKPLS